MSRSLLSIATLLILALVATACGDQTPVPSGGSTGASQSASASTDASEAATPAPPPADGRLAAVQARGTLICGVNGSLPGFSFLDESGENTGFDADFCRALAAAVLGDPEAVEFRALSTDQRGPAL